MNDILRLMIEQGQVPLHAVKEIERLNALIERSAEQLTGFMGRCCDAEAALRDYDGELDALSRLVKDGEDTVDAQHMAKQDLPKIRKRHAEALRLAGIPGGAVTTQCGHGILWAEDCGDCRSTNASI